MRRNWIGNGSLEEVDVNNELQTALTAFVNQATTLLNSGTAQLPAVLNDIVAFKLFDAWFSVYLGAVLIGAAVVLGAISILADDWAEWPIGTGILSVIVGLFGFIFTTGGIYQVYYVTHFPRLVILDYLKRLL